MKRILLVFCVFLSLLTLAGCGSVQYVTLTDKVPVSIPESFFTKVEVPAPPDRDAYLKMSASDKEKVLTVLVLQLYKTINNQDKIIDLIHTYNSEQIKIINAANTNKKDSKK